MGKHEEEVEEEETAPFWVISFSDMMTLMLTFFIMLFSMSSQDKVKVEAAIGSMQERFGFYTTVDGGVPYSHGSSMEKGNRSRGRSGRGALSQGNPVLSASGGALQFRAKPTQESMPGGVVYFDLGSPDLNETAKTKLKAIAEELKGNPNIIEIRGHTGTESGVYSNDMFMLGFLRAQRVNDELVRLGINQKKLRPSSAGAYEPISQMLKSEGKTVQQANAFVELIFAGEIHDDNSAK